MFFRVLVFQHPSFQGPGRESESKVRVQVLETAINNSQFKITNIKGSSQTKLMQSLQSVL